VAPIKSEIKDVAPCLKELKIEVPSAEVEAEMEAVYSDLKRKASVPGFRVGHAPRDLLERHYGEKAKEECIQRLIERSLNEALKNLGELDLVTRPSVSEVKFDLKSPLRYSARLEVAPAVPLSRYKGLKLQCPKIQIQEEAVDQVLKALQETHAELKPALILRPTQEGDFLLVDLTQEEKDRPPVKRQDVLIHLDLSKDPEGALKPLLGMNPGERRSVSLKDAVTATVELKVIKVKELMPLSDDFAKTAGPFESLEALKAQIKEELKHRAEVSRKGHLEAEALHQLLEVWNFDLPPSLVASFARRILREKAVELMQQGVPPEEVQERAKQMTDQAKLDAFKEVKLFFTLRRIASEEKFTASSEEVEARVKAIADAMR